MFWLLMKIRLLSARNVVRDSLRRHPLLVTGLSLLGIGLFVLAYLVVFFVFAFAHDRNVLPETLYQVFYFLFLFLLPARCPSSPPRCCTPPTTRCSSPRRCRRAPSSPPSSWTPPSPIRYSLRSSACLPLSPAPPCWACRCWAGCCCPCSSGCSCWFPRC